MRVDVWFILALLGIILIFVIAIVALSLTYALLRAITDKVEIQVKEQTRQ